MKSNKTKTWFVLLYLLVASFLIVSISLARYFSDTAGSGLVNVASVAAEMSQFSLPIEGMSPGDSKEFEFDVVNYTVEADLEKVSQVAQEYKIAIETTGNLPLTFQVLGKVKKGNPGETALWDNNKQIAETGSFPAGASSRHSYTLVVTWEDTGGENYNFSDEVDLVTVKVRAEQILESDKGVKRP